MTAGALEVERADEELDDSVASDGHLVGTRTRTLWVRSPVKLTEDDVVFYLGIHAGDPHPVFFYARCNRIRCKPEKSVPPYNYWMVTVDYSTETALVNYSNDPTQDPCIREWTTIEGTRRILFDKHGKIILNSAGSPFVDGLEVWEESPQVTWFRNQWFLDPEVVRVYNNSTNSDSFYGADPGTLRVKITGKETFDRGCLYVQCTYVMRYKADGWDPHPLNAGRYRKSGSQLVEILDKDGVPVTDPVALDTAGQPIPPSQVLDNAYLLDVEHYNRIPFGDLNLPT